MQSDGAGNELLRWELMSVALKQSITAWIRINVVSQCITDSAKCYCSWQLSLAWRLEKLCVLPWENRTFQGRKGALPCQQHHWNSVWKQRVEAIGTHILGSSCWQWCRVWEVPFPGRGGWQRPEFHLWSRRDLRVPCTKWEQVEQDELCCGVQFSLL